MAKNIDKNGLEGLVNAIQETSRFFLNQVQKQVNTSLTLRNWVIGYYIVEYEQKGHDRAEYGEKLFQKLAERLKAAGIKGFSFTMLHLCKQFYETYPQILQSVPEEFQPTDIQLHKSIESTTPIFDQVENTPNHLLLSRLSFTHFVELIKTEGSMKRIFYETEAINNNWSVRELQRAINSMLFERTGLSKDKQSVLEKHRSGTGLTPEDIFRNPYMLDFLGLAEKATYVETDLEQAIIDHLQRFLLELGKGFCFEARQKRITFDNTHYRIDHHVFVSKYMTNLPTESELQKIIVEERKKIQE